MQFVFHPDTIQDRDDYKDLDERYLLTVEEMLVGHGP